MKRIKTLLIAVALTLGATSFMHAQTKVAHISAQELVESMPDYTSAMSQLEKLGKTHEADIQEMVKEYQATLERYDAEATTKTDEENQRRMAELQQTQRSIGEFEQTIRQEMQKKQMDLLKPVMEKANETIQKVARDKGYEYVLDTSPGAGILLADGYDLMPDVKKALGM